MKHDDMRSIAHNVADSLASGCGLLIGVFEMDIFGEAARNPDGCVTVDFLAGEVVGGEVSASLADSVRRYRDVLPKLCEGYGGSQNDFRLMQATYRAGYQKHVTVRIEDQDGRWSSDEYAGVPLARIKGLDDLGRVRGVPTKRGHLA
jgi:hypothetical protein